MPDCFLTQLNLNPYHCSLVEKSLRLSGFLPILISGPSLFRYFECERQAQTDIYIFSDDNVIPATRNTIAQLLEVFARYPDYAQLGVNWDRHHFDSNKEVLERGYVRGLQVIRRGVLKDLGYAMEDDNEAIGKTFKKLGYKVGIVKNLYSIQL